MDRKKKAIRDKVSMEKILKLIDLGEVCEVMKKNNENRSYFKEKHEKIAEKHAGRIVAVASGKIASVPFTDSISEAKQNFETLEREIGKENMRGAYISYIPKPGETLML